VVKPRKFKDDDMMYTPCHYHIIEGRITNNIDVIYSCVDIILSNSSLIINSRFLPLLLMQMARVWDARYVKMQHYDILLLPHLIQYSSLILNCNLQYAVLCMELMKKIVAQIGKMEYTNPAKMEVEVSLRKRVPSPDEINMYEY